MDRNSTGETPSVMCPPQEAGFTLNQLALTWLRRPNAQNNTIMGEKAAIINIVTTEASVIPAAFQ